MNKKQIADSSAQNDSKPIVGCRYFFVTTTGKEDNNSVSINGFDIKKHDGKYPTMAECISASKKLYESQKQVMLVAITELNKEDWDQFVSAQ